MFNGSYKYLPVVLLLSILSLCPFPLFLRGDSGTIWSYRPEIVRVNDGLSFIYHRDQSSSTTVVRIFIMGGKNAEPPDKKGLAYAAAQICTGRSDLMDLIHLEAMGGSISAEVEGDFIVVTIAILSEFLDKALDMAVDFIIKPGVQASRFKGLKRSMGDLRRREEDDAEESMIVRFADIFFPKTGYSGSVYGGEESLNFISAKDIRAFYKKYVHLSNMVISISSELSRDRMRDIIKKHFRGFARGGGSTGDANAGIPKAVVPGEKEYYFDKPLNQGLVSMAAPLPGTPSSNYTYAYMVERLLSGIHGKFHALRWEKGLAYSVTARVHHRLNGSLLYTYLKTHPSKINIAVPSLKAVWNELYQNGVSMEEFRAIKKACRVSIPVENETKRIRTYSLGVFECFGIGYSRLETLPDDIDRITFEDFNAYVKKVFDPGKRAVVVIGPGVRRPAAEEQGQAPSLKAYDETSLIKAVSYYRSPGETGEGTSLPNLADALQRLGYFLVENDRNMEAENPLKEALEIYRGLDKKEPGMYSARIASLLQELGLIYTGASRLQEARDRLEESVRIYLSLEDRPTNKYEYVAPSLVFSSLALVSSNSGNEDDARRYFKKTLEYVESGAEELDDDHLALLAVAYHRLGAGDLHSFSMKKSDAVVLLESALEIWEKLAAGNPDKLERYELFLCMTMLDLSLALIKYSDQKNFEKNWNRARAMVKRSISILNKFPDNPRAVTLLKRAKEIQQSFGD